MKRAKKPGDRRGTHPNSIANLNPIKPGEVRNPEGRRRQPWSDADLATSQEPVPEIVRLKMNATLGAMLKIDGRKKVEDILPAGVSWMEAISIRKHLRALVECDIGILDHVRNGLEGTPTQRIEATGKDGEPLTPQAHPNFVFRVVDPSPKVPPAAPMPAESSPEK